MTEDTITAIKKTLEGVNSAFLRVLSEAPTDAAHYSIGLDLEGSAIRITLEDMRAIASIPATLESLQRENEELRERLKPLALLEIPKSPHFTAAPYSIFFEDIEAARTALSSTGDTHAK